MDVKLLLKNPEFERKLLLIFESSFNTGKIFYMSGFFTNLGAFWIKVTPKPMKGQY